MGGVEPECMLQRNPPAESSCWPTAEMKRAGHPITKSKHTFRVGEIRGDWEFHKFVWKFKCGWKSNDVCFCCPATAKDFGDPSQLYWNCDENSMWNSQPFTTLDYINHRLPSHHVCNLVFEISGFFAVSWLFHGNHDSVICTLIIAYFFHHLFFLVGLGFIVIPLSTSKVLWSIWPNLTWGRSNGVWCTQSILGSCIAQMVHLCHFGLTNLVSFAKILWVSMRATGNQHDVQLLSSQVAACGSKIPLVWEMEL